MTSHRNKARRKSALAHGIYASDVLLPWEHKRDFIEILDALIVEFQPIGPSETHTVHELAELHWRRRRAGRFAQIAMMRAPVVRAIDATKKHSAGAISRSLNEQSDPQMALEANVRTIASNAAEISERMNRRRGVETLGEEAAEVLASVERILALLRSSNVMRDTEAEALDVVDRLNRIERDLDAAIDRKIKRLVMIKELKKMYPSPNVIEHMPERDVPQPKAIKNLESRKRPLREFERINLGHHAFVDRRQQK